MGTVLQRAFVLIALLCLLSGIIGFTIALSIYDTRPAPMTDEEKAQANIDRLLEQFYKKRKKAAPYAIEGGDGSTKEITARIWVDPVNGCQYLLTVTGSAFTPRMGPGSVQMCNP